MTLGSDPREQHRHVRDEVVPALPALQQLSFGCWPPRDILVGSGDRRGIDLRTLLAP
jgi:hypothetical protein